MFNSQSTIQVGGRWNRNKGRVERPFLGVIVGLVVNGARILELAAAKDGRVTTRGDVQLLPAGSLLDRAAPLQRMQQVNRGEVFHVIRYHKCRNFSIRIISLGITTPPSTLYHD